MKRDYPVVMGTLYVFTLMGLLAKLLSDISYSSGKSAHPFRRPDRAITACAAPAMLSDGLEYKKHMQQNLSPSSAWQAFKQHKRGFAGFAPARRAVCTSLVGAALEQRQAFVWCITGQLLFSDGEKL